MSSAVTAVTVSPMKQMTLHGCLILPLLAGPLRNLLTDRMPTSWSWKWVFALASAILALRYRGCDNFLRHLSFARSAFRVPWTRPSLKDPIAGLLRSWQYLVEAARGDTIHDGFPAGLAVQSFSARFLQLQHLVIRTEETIS